MQLAIPKNQQSCKNPYGIGLSIKLSNLIHLSLNKNSDFLLKPNIEFKLQSSFCFIAIYH